nr:MAG TPA: hypothetical protein [Bacteriophage sp.]
MYLSREVYHNTSRESGTRLFLMYSSIGAPYYLALISL